MHRRSLATLLALCLVSFAAGDALAGEAEAAEAFKAGAAAYARGDFRTAATSFARAYREAPRGAAIYNAGLAWEATAETARAADAYATALGAGDLGAAQSSDARARLGALEKSLGRVQVSGPAGATITVGHAESLPTPATVHLAPGPHEVTARFTDGTTARRSVTVNADAAVPLVFEAPKAALAPPPSPPPVASGAIGTPSPPRTQRTIGFVALGGAVVASGAAVVFGLTAVSAKNDFNDSGHHDADAHDRADQFRLMSNVAWVAAGVLAVGGVVLVLTAPRARSAPSTTAGIGPRGAFLSVPF